MKKIFVIIWVLLGSVQGFSQRIFNANSKNFTVTINKEEVIDLELYANEDPNLIGIECKFIKNSVVFSDGKNSIRFVIEKGQEIDFVANIDQKEKINVRLVGIAPNENFTPEYIQHYKGKMLVDIPEVSELVNVILALHKDAEKDNNMFDTQTDYYKRVKEYFAPFRSHPAVALIEKHMPSPELHPQLGVYLFSKDSYNYFYALKMNACAYVFDKEGNIKNNGFIREIALDWYTFDPMIDLAIFEDFAKKSNFRKFYQNNKLYYDNLLTDYHKLVPLTKMKNWLENKFGFGYDSYLIYFSPLNKGAQATIQHENNNFKQAFMFVAKVSEDEKLSKISNELYASWVVFTEIDHNYVNPLSLEYGIISRINKIFTSEWIEGESITMYDSSYKVYNEYMTFALFSLYISDNYDAKDVENFIPYLENMMQNSRGFVRFKDFNRALLDKYKQNPNIPMKELYHYILSWAENIAKKSYPIG